MDSYTKDQFNHLKKLVNDERIKNGHSKLNNEKFLSEIIDYISSQDKVYLGSVFISPRNNRG